MSRFWIILLLDLLAMNLFFEHKAVLGANWAGALTGAAWAANGLAVTHATREKRCPCEKKDE